MSYTNEEILELIEAQPPEIRDHVRAALLHSVRLSKGLDEPEADLPSALEKLVEIGAEAAKGFPPVGPIVGEALKALLIVMHAAQRIEGRKAAALGSAFGLSAAVASRNAGRAARKKKP